MTYVRKSLSLIAVVSLLVGLAGPALAHTKVDKTSPTDGETVAAGKITLTVAFTDTVLDLADSSEIVLTGEDGSESGVGCVVVTERGIKAEAFVGTEGTYRVSWRTVAEDGHPIDGDFSFKVTGTSEDDSITCKDGVTTAVPKKADPVVIAPKPVEKSDDSGMIYNYLIGAGLLAVAVAIIVLLRRRKTTK